MSRTLIVGIGSEHGDDRAGWLVADELRKQLVDNRNVEVRTAAVPLDLMDWLEDFDELQICDACDSTAFGEGVLRFSWSGQSLANGNLQVSDARGYGTHGFGVSEVLRLADTLGRLPQRVVVWAIPGRSFDVNKTLSKGTVEMIHHAVEVIIDEVRRRR